MKMAAMVFTIRLINTSQLYSVHHFRKHMGKTKIVYFDTKSDAKKFATFLSQTSIQNPLLYEYVEPDEILENSMYKVLEVNEEFIKRDTGVSNMGYHKCIISNGNVTCIETGFQTMNECIIVDYLEKLLQLEVR